MFENYRIKASLVSVLYKLNFIDDEQMIEVATDWAWVAAVGRSVDA